jgi:hypothetical protein
MLSHEYRRTRGVERPAASTSNVTRYFLADMNLSVFADNAQRVSATHEKD